LCIFSFSDIFLAFLVVVRRQFFFSGEARFDQWDQQFARSSVRVHSKLHANQSAAINKLLFKLPRRRSSSRMGR
jgi:hypothetical protein